LKKLHTIASISVVVILIGIIPSYSTSYDIPAWIKVVAGFWSQGNISDDEFGESISFLIDQEILQVPIVESLRQENTQLQSQVDTLKNTVDEQEQENDSLREDLDELSSPIFDVSVPPGASGSTCNAKKTCFIPTTTKIDVGDTVTWSNDDSITHTVTSVRTDDVPFGKKFDSDMMLAGEIFSHKFEEPGNYPYQCLLHPWMKAEVIVG